jgi:hypothetical protein
MNSRVEHVLDHALREEVPPAAIPLEIKRFELDWLKPLKLSAISFRSQFCLSRRAAMIQAQRDKPSIVQRVHVANDPRWPERRRKLAAAQDAKCMTREPAAMRKKGRNFTPVGAWAHRV